MSILRRNKFRYTSKRICCWKGVTKEMVTFTDFSCKASNHQLSWCTNPLIILDLDLLSKIHINNNVEKVFSRTLSLDVLHWFEVGETHWLADDFKLAD